MPMLDQPFDEVMAEIKRGAREYWGDNPQMLAYVIKTEAKAFQSLQTLNFRAAASQREAILDRAGEIFDTWEERLSAVEGEIDAFEEIQSFTDDDVPEPELIQMKIAAAKAADDYTQQLEELQQRVDGYRYVQKIRAEVGPLAEILVKMEALIGRECYNANIQNYSAWGEWDGEGRSFRYPITFYADGEERKGWRVSADIKPEHLITGYYKFGANELNIFRALKKVIEMLQREYGLTVSTRAEHV